MSHPLERIVEHAVRLDVLCCLIDGEALTATQLGARIGKTSNVADYHVGVLAAHDLVAREGEFDDEGSLYVAKLGDHPDWVRKAVEDHRRRD